MLRDLPLQFGVDVGTQVPCAGPLYDQFRDVAQLDVGPPGYLPKDVSALVGCPIAGPEGFRAGVRRAQCLSGPAERAVDARRCSGEVQSSLYSLPCTSLTHLRLEEKRQPHAGQDQDDSVSRSRRS